ncbi:MAG: hypothetical protein HOO06_07940 [Bdellovibrionaceae bacterium]|jgi:hypothetical protein|nr:hypothetical protein [Pseudobdellovibrionaceae bacterium]
MKKETRNTKSYWQKTLAIAVIASALFTVSCDDKGSSRTNVGSNGIGKQCSDCPIQTDTLARAWGQANDQLRQLEMGLHFYIDMEKYNVDDYRSSSNQYLGNFNGEMAWAEGYMTVHMDRSGGCSLAQGDYDVKTVAPAQIQQNGVYNYGTTTGSPSINGLRLEARHIGSDEVVTMVWENAYFSSLHPYVISEVDNVEYPNGIEATVRIERIDGSGINCTP